MHLTRKNIIANYGSKIYSFISIYLFVPFYIKILGAEAYGIIGLYSLLLGLISFADAGISSAINREFAKTDDAAYKRSLLLVFEKLYLAICLSVFLIIYLSAPLITKYWLGSHNYPEEEVIYYLRLIGFGVIIQLFTSIYTGALMGQQRQVRANSLQILWSSVRGGLVIPVIFLKPGLDVFFSWTILANVMYVLVLRYSTFSLLGKTSPANPLTLRKIDPGIWKYIGGMIVIAILSAFAMQVDKLMVSHFFSVEVFGFYNLTTIIAQVPFFLAIPVALAVFPILTKSVASKDEGPQIAAITRYSYLANALILTGAVTLYFYGFELLGVWIGKSDIPAHLIPEIRQTLKLLVVANGFFAWQLVPYYYLLARGKTRYTIIQTAAQLILLFPALYYLISLMSLPGAGMAWFIANIGAFIYLICVMWKVILHSSWWKFLLITFIYPGLINTAIGLFLFRIAEKYETNHSAYLFAALTGVICILVNYAYYKKLIEK